MMSSEQILIRCADMALLLLTKRSSLADAVAV